MKRAIFLLCLCMISFTACGSDDSPPSNSTPAPAPQNGVFANEHGTMTFNGDGRTVTIEGDATLEKLMGLSGDKQDLSYVFLFHNEEWRCDGAEYFRIIIDENNYLQFSNSIGQTDEDTVAFYVESGEKLVFEKEH